MALAVPLLRGAPAVTVLVAGGGVAGAAAACLLGRRALLVEREAGPHDKVCGEFLSWEALDALAALGLDVPALGGAPIGAVRLVHGARVATRALPRAAMGLSRRVLDEALLVLAARRGAEVMRGRAVRRLVPNGAEVDGIGHVTVDRVLLATGKHELRGLRRPALGAPLVGMKMQYRLAPAADAALAGHVEVVLFPGGYAGLQPVGDGVANLCLLIGQTAFSEAGADWAGALAHMCRHSPHLAQRLVGALPCLARPLAIFRVPYGHVHRPAAADPAGVLRLGDQMGVIPSFSGDGMAIALHTAFAAVNGSPAAYHARMRGDLAGQIGRAMAVHRLGLGRPGWVAGAARAWPGAMAWVARLTRVAPGRLAWRQPAPAR